MMSSSSNYTEIAYLCVIETHLYCTVTISKQVEFLLPTWNKVQRVYQIEWLTSDSGYAHAAQLELFELIASWTDNQ